MTTNEIQFCVGYVAVGLLSMAALWLGGSISLMLWELLRLAIHEQREMRRWKRESAAMRQADRLQSPYHRMYH